MAAAMAQPTAWGNCVARLPEMVKMLPLPQWYMMGICRPLHMSRVFERQDRKSTRLNSSHSQISYAVFCLKKKYSILTSSRSTQPRDCASMQRGTLLYHAYKY